MAMQSTVALLFHILSLFLECSQNSILDVEVLWKATCIFDCSQCMEVRAGFGLIDKVNSIIIKYYFLGIVTLGHFLVLSDL